MAMAIGLLAAACGADEGRPTGATVATTETGPTATAAEPADTQPEPTEPSSGPEFTIAPVQGAPGTVFLASGDGCADGGSSAPRSAVYLTVRIEDVPEVPALGAGGVGLVVEQHLVAVAAGSWSEELDSGAWPHWVAGADPPRYDGVGANPGVYRVSVLCGPPDPAGITIDEPLFAYPDRDLVVAGS